MLKSVKYTPNGMEIKMVTGNNVTFLLDDIQRECIRAKINEESLAFFHRDYFDLGEMVYERLPGVGWVIKKVKNRLKH